MTAATKITPRPPIWIRIRIIIWPNIDQCVAVSTTIRPVTHIEDVAVKRHVKKSEGSEVLLDIGKLSKIAPKNIASIKLPTIV